MSYFPPQYYFNYTITYVHWRKNLNIEKEERERKMGRKGGEGGRKGRKKGGKEGRKREKFKFGLSFNLLYPL